MKDSINTKAVVTVSEMARMVGLSRSRFYQLQGTAFPHPKRDPETKRPFYDQAQQETCLEVRRKNCGIDGRPVLFYAQRPSQPAKTPGRKKARAATPPRPSKAVKAILEGVRALGLASATQRQVEESVGKLFPKGTTDLEQGEVIRAVFVDLMRQNSPDNVGR